MKTAKHIPSIPPEDPARQELRLAETPAYLKRLYGVAIGYQQIVKWGKDGLVNRQGKRVYLKTYRIGRNRMVTKKDLIEFIKNA